MLVQRGALTIEEYHRLVELPENSERILELIDGELVEKMPSFKPSRLAAMFIHWVQLYLDANPLGVVTGADGGYIMNNGNLFIPDVGYISKARLPDEPEREVPVPPDLAIEIKSPTDRKRALRRKAERYIELGTTLVWLVFPEDRIIEVYSADDELRVLTMDDILDGGTVLPGFNVTVARVFSVS